MQKRKTYPPVTLALLGRQPPLGKGAIGGRAQGPPLRGYVRLRRRGRPPDGPLVRPALPACHPERSEGSRPRHMVGSGEILRRCASQNDSPQARLLVSRPLPSRRLRGMRRDTSSGWGGKSGSESLQARAAANPLLLFPFRCGMMPKLGAPGQTIADRCLLKTTCCPAAGRLA